LPKKIAKPSNGYKSRWGVAWEGFAKVFLQKAPQRLLEPLGFCPGRFQPGPPSPTVLRAAGVFRAGPCQIFLDWIFDMDHYFDLYNMSDERRVRFAKMKLVGQARQYWMNIERLVRLRYQGAIQTWDEIKLKLQKKYLSGHTTNVCLTNDNV